MLRYGSNDKPKGTEKAGQGVRLKPHNPAQTSYP